MTLVKSLFFSFRKLIANTYRELHKDADKAGHSESGLRDGYTVIDFGAAVYNHGGTLAMLQDGVNKKANIIMCNY